MPKAFTTGTVNGSMPDPEVQRQMSWRASTTVG